MSELAERGRGALAQARERRVPPTTREEARARLFAVAAPRAREHHGLLGRLEDLPRALPFSVLGVAFVLGVAAGSSGRWKAATEAAVVGTFRGWRPAIIGLLTRMLLR